MLKILSRGVAFFIALFALSACGYYWGQGGEIISKYETISIPYVDGDLDGWLTAAIIKEATIKAGLDYRRDNGDLILRVKLVDLSDENIGFRYDRKKKGNLTHSIIPTETRVIAVVEVLLIEAASDCVLLGPALISASVDFDHDYYSSRNGVNVFSLGQLTDIDEAKDAVRRPLNYALAQKIIDFIIDSW